MWSINKNQFYSEKKKMINKSWKNWKKAICNQPYVYNGGINRHTAHMCAKTAQRRAARRQFLASEARQSQTNFWRAKRVLWEKIWRPNRDFDNVFFFLNCGCGAIPPQKCHPLPPPRLEGGNFPGPVKKQSEMPKNFVCNSDIIPKKISPCGAIAKKNHTQNIYNLDTIAATGFRAILN